MNAGSELTLCTARWYLIGCLAVTHEGKFHFTEAHAWFDGDSRDDGDQSEDKVANWVEIMKEHCNSLLTRTDIVIVEPPEPPPKCPTTLPPTTLPPTTTVPPTTQPPTTQPPTTLPPTPTTRRTTQKPTRRSTTRRPTVRPTTLPPLKAPLGTLRVEVIDASGDGTSTEPTTLPPLPAPDGKMVVEVVEASGNDDSYDSYEYYD